MFLEFRLSCIFLKHHGDKELDKIKKMPDIVFLLYANFTTP